MSWLLPLNVRSSRNNCTFCLSRNADEFFLKFDSSSMAFNPSIVPPNPKSTVKAAKGSRHLFANSYLETECSASLRKAMEPQEDIMDFNRALIKRRK